MAVERDLAFPQYVFLNAQPNEAHLSLFIKFGSTHKTKYDLQTIIGTFKKCEMERAQSKMMVALN